MLQRCLGVLVTCLAGIVSLQAQEEFLVVSPIDSPAAATRTTMLDWPHGEVLGLLGNGSPDLSTLPATVLVPLSDFAASAGGEILGHRNSYFLSVDRQAFDWSRLGLPANDSLLSALGRKPVNSSARSLAFRETLGRFDHRFNQRDTVDLRTNGFRTSSKQFAASAFNAEGQMSTIDNAFAISPATVNETRGQITSVNVQLPADAVVEAIPSGYATGHRFQVYEAADNLDHQGAGQELRGGGSFLWNHDSVAFLPGDGGNSKFKQSYRRADLYLQDRWRLGPHLVVTAGVRYDLPLLGGVRMDAHKLGPLLGFAWSPGGSPSNVLRGGYGVAYQQLSLPVFLGAPDPAANPLVVPRSESIRWSGPLSSVFTPSALVQEVYAEHAHLEFEHQFGESSRLVAAYQHVRGVEVTFPGNPGLTGDRQDRSGNRSGYEALSVTFAQQPASWGDYRIAYSYADGSAPLVRGWDNIVADQIRRASFTGRVHTPFNEGSGIWDQITHSIALTAYGDVIRQNQLAGVDFVHLDARLSKEVQVGRHVRLELFLQRSGLLQHHSQSIARAFAHMSSSEEEMMSTGIQMGVRIRF